MKVLGGLSIIAMIALMQVMAPGMAMDDNGNLTADDVNEFFHDMQKTDFGDIEIAGNNITFYNPDGSVKCSGEYDYVGSKIVDFQGYPVEWHMFNLRSDDNCCQEYKHVIATKVHDEDGLNHWHMRYGKLCFDILMENPAYQMWYPTMAAEGTDAESLANSYNENTEMIGSMIVAAKKAANNATTLDDWNGRWVNTNQLLEDTLMDPAFEAASNAANAISDN